MIGSMKGKVYPMPGRGGGGGASITSGTFEVSEAAGNITGFAAGAMPACTLRWELVGTNVTLRALAGGVYTGTSDSAGFTITGLPAAIRPATLIGSGTFALIDNGVNVLGRAQLLASGQITFNKCVVAGSDVSFTTSFTASGTKGIATAFQFSYAL